MKAFLSRITINLLFICVVSVQIPIFAMEKQTEFPSTESTQKTSWRNWLGLHMPNQRTIISYPIKKVIKSFNPIAVVVAYQKVAKELKQSALENLQGITDIPEVVETYTKIYIKAHCIKLRTFYTLTKKTIVDIAFDLTRGGLKQGMGIDLNNRSCWFQDEMEECIQKGIFDGGVKDLRNNPEAAARRTGEIAATEIAYTAMKAAIKAGLRKIGRLDPDKYPSWMPQNWLMRDLAYPLVTEIADTIGGSLVDKFLVQPAFNKTFNPGGLRPGSTLRFEFTYSDLPIGE